MRKLVFGWRGWFFFFFFYIKKKRKKKRKRNWCLAGKGWHANGPRAEDWRQAPFHNLPGRRDRRSGVFRWI
jgi:hypothetical protein